jgi:hypothetical protein
VRGTQHYCEADTGGDNEYLCFELGLPYGYFKAA